MHVPLEEIGRRGRMDLTFAHQGGQTVLRHAYCEIPFKITRLLNSGDLAPHLILMQCSPGLFGGDEWECSMRLESGARVLITQQSATKVHASGASPAIQRTHVVVESGAELQLYFEPVIPFANSALRQTTCIDVEPGGRLMFWEGIMAGRIGRGERWQFRELISETVLRLGDNTIYLDRFQLPTGEEDTPWAMAGCNYLGTGLYIGDEASSFAAALHERIPGAGVDTLRSDIAITRFVSAAGPDFHRCREIFSLCAQGQTSCFR